MSEIDWSKAPEWAKQVGETRTGRHICWIGDYLYGYVGHEPKHYDLAKGPGYPGHRCLDEFEIISGRPKVEPWNGEGLPPVGTVCEFAGGTPCPDDPFDKDLREGMQVTIIAHFKSGDFTLAAFTFDPENPDRGMVQVEQGNFGCFRPIRTPEQIAADERLHEIRNALTAINSKVHFPNDLVRGNILAAAVEAMIDAGYRKQEAS